MPTKASFRIRTVFYKKRGCSILDDVEHLLIPDDLQQALQQNQEALQHFQAFPPSVKRGILEGILNAKRPEIRQKKIAETLKLAVQNISANQYRQ